MPDNRPVGREKNVQGKGSVQKHGSGIGGGPVGSGSGYSGRPGNGSGGGSYRSTGGGTRAGGMGSGLGKGKLILIAVVIILVLIFGGRFIKKFLGGGNISIPTSSFLNGFSSSSVSDGSWSRGANTGKLDTTVSSEARNKYTDIRNDGTDKVTVMVYMCGTDLESKSGMASNDLAEMAGVTYGNKVDVIVYTGGCSNWKTSKISSSTNQIYRVRKDGLELIRDNLGNKNMTNPETLTEFIRWTTDNYPANRYELIFWDHGGGSLSGYGYDEKFQGSGSMTLKKIDNALSGAGIKYDFIGFDACLMATLENALMLSKYADYLIASEETEPGIGWYYTNWLSKLNENPGMSTIDIGKIIVDDFTDTCAAKLNGQKTTLSVIDLAELEKTIPDDITDFAKSTSSLIEGSSYEKVSDARSATREFSTSKIDQVDLVDLATKMNTPEGEQLAKSILGAVKYNRTSSQMSNSYGLSVYFPYRKMSNVDSAVATYESLGLDGEYAECIKSFASLEVAGQVASGGTSSALPSLLGNIGSSSQTSGSSSSAISSLLSSFLGGGSGINISGLTSGGMNFLSGLDTDKAGRFISEKSLSSSDFLFTKYKGQKVIALTDDKWSLVQDIELNVFVDDGQGYIDLGLDNSFEYTDEGALLGEYGKTWLGINGQVVAYYHMSTEGSREDYTITGRVPVLYNGDRANLILVFTDETPEGIVTGVMFDYDEKDTETAAKIIDRDFMNVGDKIKFLCDYYSYGGEYVDSFELSEITYDGTLNISDLDISDENTNATYRITDIYNQHFWTEVM